VLDDFALEAVVIVGVRRTAGDLRRIVMSRPVLMRVGDRRAVNRIVWREIDEPRHGPDRRPDERS
jgi:hypothetical protein